MINRRCVISWLGTLGFLLVVSAVCAQKVSYNPLALPHGFKAEKVDLTVRDSLRNRDIPIRVNLPAQESPSPVILFSHGLGGSRGSCTYLAKHWSARGYAAVFLQHPGSDDSVWKDVPITRRKRAMRKAASVKNLILRVKDVSAVLDQLAKWNKQDRHVLSGLLDLSRVGMSGHSFGALTTQFVSGQSADRFGQRFTDQRIKAAITFSPSSRTDPKTAFGSVKIPWMLMTGTRDTAPIGNQSVKYRLKVFPALPPGDKYELVLYNAEHSAFTERALPGDREPRNPNHHRAIPALSTAFWDTYLHGDTAAKQWLTGSGPGNILQSKDRWHTK